MIMTKHIKQWLNIQRKKGIYEGQPILIKYNETIKELILALKKGAELIQKYMWITPLIANI